MKLCQLHRRGVDQHVKMAVADMYPLVSGQHGRANNIREPAGDGLWQEQGVSVIS